MATRTRTSGRPRLRLADFSDRELLALVSDHQDSDGWADAQVIAEAIWPRRALEDGGPRASVSIRFTWMKRWGLMERDTREPRKWRLTAWGEALAAGRLTVAQESLLEGTSDANLLHVGDVLGRRYVEADDPAAVMLRRAMEFAQHQRRGGARRG